MTRTFTLQTYPGRTRFSHRHKCPYCSDTRYCYDPSHRVPLAWRAGNHVTPKLCDTCDKSLKWYDASACRPEK